MASAPESPEAAANHLRLQQLLRSYHLTDAGNAEAFCLLHGHEFRFDHDRGCWRYWIPPHWRRDDTGAANRAALHTVRQRLAAAMEKENNKDRYDQVKCAMASENEFRIRALLASAQPMHPFATTSADYDRDPFLLTTRNVTVDLRTGLPKDCDPADLITRATDILYDPNARCPRWIQFLHEIFQGEADLIGFVQRSAGYSLTGDTREQCLFILYGGGVNGKSTFLEILLKLVGTHAAVTSFSTFLIQDNPGAPRNDLAKLQGARLVKASESQRQATLDEAMIKEITGNDVITARYLYTEWFEFKPQLKLWLTTNYKPRIRGVDEAIWRRIGLIPFNQQFTGKNQDTKLNEKLEAELSGILAWAVRGCLEWLRNGLGEAPTVEAATLDYRRESDSVGRFLNEGCTQGTTDQTSGQELFQAYVQWCADSGERPEANNGFAKILADRGMGKKRTSKGYVYVGVGLRPRVEKAKIAPGG